jgi:hypothetical protein
MDALEDGVGCARDPSDCIWTGAWGGTSLETPEREACPSLLVLWYVTTTRSRDMHAGVTVRQRAGPTFFVPNGGSEWVPIKQRSIPITLKRQQHRVESETGTRMGRDR